MEPIPEGVYSIGNPEWSPTSWGEGLGPMWIDVYGTGDRTAIGIHLDANRETSPGTAGCIGLLHADDLQKVAVWFDREKKPAFLIVDHGLGTIPGHFSD